MEYQGRAAIAPETEDWRHLREIINGVAGVHDNQTDENNIQRIAKAIEAGSINACYLKVDFGNGKFHFAGGAIEFPTVFTKRHGDGFAHYPAIYCEDTYVSNVYSTRFRAITNTGLGGYFIQQRIKHAFVAETSVLTPRSFPAARISETALDNIRMANILKKIGGVVWTENESAVLEINENMFAQQTGWDDVPVKTEDFFFRPHSEAPVFQPHIFMTSWKNLRTGQQIVATFTEAISTFSGKPIVRVQLTSRGGCPSEMLARNILGALLSAGRDEILNRFWFYDPINLRHAMSSIKIHVVNEPILASALKSMGARNRMLGAHKLAPVTVNFDNLPEGLSNLAHRPSAPFEHIEQEKDGNGYMPWLNPALHCRPNVSAFYA